MRKTNPGHRSPSAGSKRPNSRSSRGPQAGGPPNNNRNRPGGGARSRNQASQMWLQASPKTLTSHIPMMHKNATRDGAARRGEGRNEWENGGGGNNRTRPNKGRNVPDKNRQQRPPAARQDTKSRPPRQPSAASDASRPAAGKTARPVENRDDKLVANIEPFDLFCAYHLGISRDNRYKPANINEVANRFATEPATIRQALKAYNMDSASLLDRDYDMALAQLDIQVAPEGVDRMELAKNLYLEFLDSPVLKRDWNKILEEDRKENQKIFKD